MPFKQPTVYLFVAIIAVALVAYVVYQRCRPKIHEPFSNTQFVTEFDTLNPAFDAKQCVGDNCENRMVEPKARQHIDEARVSFLENTVKVGAVQYGVVQETDVQKLPMYALSCMWSNVDSHSGVTQQSQIDVELAVTVFVKYNIGASAHMLTKSFDVQLSVDKTYRSFIPINTDIIHRKIAHNAKVVRVCIERKDTSQAVLGVEKVCVVKYVASAGNTWNGNLSADKTSLSAYAYDAGKNNVPQDIEGTQLGKRVEMGVMLCDPVGLVSQSYAPTKDSAFVGLATTPAILGDVSYQRVEPAYGSTGTQALRVRVSFSDIKTPTQITLYFSTLKTSDQTAFNGYRNGQALPLFAATMTTSTSAPPLHPHNVAKATLFDVEPDVVYEFYIALAEQQMQQTSFDVLALDSANANSVIQSMHCEPMDGSHNAPTELLRNTKVTANYTTLPNLAHINETKVCGDYLVDADSTILRFNNRSTHLSECGVFSVNDGLVFCGSLLAATRAGVMNANLLCSLSLTFSNKRRLIMKLTRDGVYLYEVKLLGNQSILSVPVSIEANNVSWYIYLHKESVGVCINNHTTFNTHDILKSLYTREDHRILEDAYPVLTNVKLSVDPKHTVESRVITALAMKPSVGDMKRSRSDTATLLETKASLAFGQRNNLTPRDPALVTRALSHPRCTMSRDSGVSVQCELKMENIVKAIQNTKERFYVKSPNNPRKAGEAVVFKNETVRVVLQQQQSDNPSPLLFNIAVYFTTECGSFVTIPSVLGTHKLFEPTREGVVPRVFIKYTNYEKAERVCIVRYGQMLQGARVHASIEHQLSNKAMKPYAAFTYNPHMMVSVIVGARALSTNCNPYNNAKMCDCTGRISADPSNGLTNIPRPAILTEALASVAEHSYINNPEHETPMPNEQACIKYAGDTYGVDGVASFTTASNGENMCSIAAYPTNIKVDHQKDSKSFMFKHMTDEGMRLLLQMF